MKFVSILSTLLLVAIAPGDVASDERVAIDQFAWLTGHWVGDGFGGVSEEMWTEPKGGAMLGIYRHLKEGQNNFYEFIQLSEEDGTVRLRLKHFNPDMTGWENKEDYVEFPFVSVEPDKAVFKGLVYERVADGGMKVTLTLHDKEKTWEEVFTFKKIR